MSERSGGAVLEPACCCSSVLGADDDHFLFQSSCCLSYQVAVSVVFGVDSLGTAGPSTTFDNSSYWYPWIIHFYFPLRPAFKLVS